MIKNCFSLFSFPILIISLFLICSCSQEAYNLPDLNHDSVKDQKYLVLTAGDASIKNTGVYVQKGDLYSIVVSGYIYIEHLVINVTKENKIGPSPGLGVKIDEKLQKIPPINATLEAQNTGEISIFRNIRKKGGYFQGGSGGFKITIIVWNTRDLNYIADYFKQVELATPEQEHLKGISDQAISLKTYLNKLHPDTELSLMEKKSTGVEKSELQIKLNSDEKNKPLLKPEEVETKSQIKVGVNIDTNKINGDKYSPVMLIVAPKDGQTISSVAMQLIGVVEDDNG